MTVLLLLLSRDLQASPEGAPEYNRDIRPILSENCFSCHGADSASRQADLRLDQRDAAVKYGAITPGAPDKSALIERIFADDADQVMPPPETKKRLTSPQKELLRRWIAKGAEYELHWSYIGPRKPELPNVGNEAWTRGAIDRFILSRLEVVGLLPAPEADAWTLLRRLHLDITGLPPKADDVVQFVSDYRESKDLALSKWIDRLMESPAWGEHRGRYWLDAARYADTHGLHYDNYREMWSYRDWVIRAFDANQPFDEFLIDQLAGDLLENPTDDQLVATGFQRCNMTTNEGGTILEENLAIYAADRVQTFGWVCLGLTLNCAQCHDHKFDPLTMRDYYSLAAFFRNTTAPAMDGNVKGGRGPVLVVPREKDRPRWQSVAEDIAATKIKITAREQLVTQQFEAWLAQITAEELRDGVTNGLVLHVPMNEGAGNEVRNLVGSPGKFYATGQIQWVSGGKLGPAPQLVRPSTIVLGDQGDFEIDQPFSFGAWIKAARRGITVAILARMDPAGNGRGWDLWQNYESLAVHLVDTWDSNAIKVKTVEEVLRFGQWQHVFVTYDGSATPGGLKIYVDGLLADTKVEKNTLQKNATIRTDVPLRVGGREGAAYFHNGATQDLRLYERELASEEVTRIPRSAKLRAALETAAVDRIDADRRMLLVHFLMNNDNEYPLLTRALSALEAEQEAIRARSAVTHIQQERSDRAPMAHMLMRGAYDHPGEELSAATPAALHPLREDAPRNRLGLARWTVAPANPLTARVTVNRFWQEVFGQGLVTTAEDFGVSGALPSHPDLLDWLATDFVEHGWDVKRLFKQILMSATYRQSAEVSPSKLETDPHNGLLSRGPRFRMDAEMVRDYSLAVSGLLSPRMFGPGTKPYQPGDIWNVVGLPSSDTRDYTQDTGANLYRRTVYNFWKRMAPPPNLEAFNAPSREVCVVRRERTNTPLQALVALNDPQFVEAARRLAEMTINQGKGDDDKALEHIAMRVLGRRLYDDERGIVLSAKEDFLNYYRKNPGDAQDLVKVGDSPVDPGLDLSVLAAWTMICNQVMNLDEALNK